MAPTNTGRYCAACQHPVIDFTRMSQAEVLAYLAGAGRERVCGAFRPDQLQATPASRWRRWAAAALTLLGLRAAMPPAATAQAGRTLGAPQAVAARYPARVLRGQVRAAGTGQPLAHAAVQVEGGGQPVQTDAQGWFRLALPALPATARLRVVPAAGHYGSAQVALPAPGSTAPLVVLLPGGPPPMLLGRPALPHPAK